MCSFCFVEQVLSNQCFHLGFCFWDGTHGIPLDKQMAVYFFKKAQNGIPHPYRVTDQLTQRMEEKIKEFEAEQNNS